MTQRNQICPCGSGKKYKKCCLVREWEADELAVETLRKADEERRRDPASKSKALATLLALSATMPTGRK